MAVTDGEMYVRLWSTNSPTLKTAVFKPCFVHKNDTWTTDGKAADDKRYSPWSMVLVTESLPLLVVAHDLVLSKRGKLSAASVKVLSTFGGMHRTLTHYTTHDTIVD